MQQDSVDEPPRKKVHFDTVEPQFKVPQNIAASSNHNVASTAQPEEERVLKDPEWDCEATQCVRLCFVQSLETLDDDVQRGEPPLFANQTFDNEVISGYKDPLLKLIFKADTLQCLLQFTFSAQRHGSEDTKVLTEVVKRLPRSVAIYTERSDFERLFVSTDAEKNAFSAPGDLLGQFAVAKLNCNFKMFRGSAAQEDVSQYLQRVQSLVTWYIDGASVVDATDAQWVVYFLFEEKSDGRLFLAGFTTVYQFYSYPDKIRLRISQVLVLPHYQRSGLASRMVRQIYADARADANVADITVESPSDEFTMLRDLLDLEDLHRAGLLSKAAFALSDQWLEEVRVKLKLYKPQARHCHLLNDYVHLNKEDDTALRNYRIRYKREMKREAKDELVGLEEEFVKQKLAEWWEIEKGTLEVVRESMQKRTLLH